MLVPDAVIDAAKHGNIPPVEAWLDAEGSDVNAFDARGSTLLLECVGSPTGSRDAIGLCRLLLARGANPNLRGTGSGERYPRTRTSRGDIPPLWETAYTRSHMCELLIENGANVEALATGFDLDSGGVSHSLGPMDDRACQCTLLANLLYFVGGEMMDSQRLTRLYMLLRAGAKWQSIVKPYASDETYSGAWCLEQGEARWRRWRAMSNRSSEYMDQDRYVLAIKALVAGMEADGSFKAYVRRPHRSVLRLRSLFTRDRATLKILRRRPRGRDARAEGATAFLVKLGDNGIAWNILSFWKDTTILHLVPHFIDVLTKHGARTGFVISPYMHRDSGPGP